MKSLIVLGFFIMACHNEGVEQGKEGKTLLWQISGPGISKPSYLYGTIHIMCPDDIVITDKLKECFNSTTQLYLELDLDDPSTMMDAMKGMMMKHDTTLQQLMSKEEYDSLAYNFKKITGMPLTLMNGMQPMLTEAAIY